MANILDDKTRKKVVETLQRVWSYIGDDMFLDIDGKLDESIVHARDDVFELCAERLYDELDHETRKLWHSIPWDSEEKNSIKKEAFPFKYYGM